MYDLDMIIFSILSFYKLIHFIWLYVKQIDKQTIFKINS
jgi:hypothetical protein